MTPARRSGGRLSLVGREPPHDLDAEAALLGAMLLSRAAATTGIELVGPTDFYKPAHGHIFEAIARLVLGNRSADPVTVADELRRMDVLEAVGDPAVLLSMQINTPSSTNVVYYAEIVARLAGHRRQMTEATEVIEALRRGDDERAASHLAALQDVGYSQRNDLEGADVAALMRSPERIEADLLYCADGRALLMRGSVNLIHGEPEAGKSFLALEAIRQVLEAGERAVLLDYEGSPPMLADRLNDMQVDPDVVETQMLYLRPGGASEAKRRSWLAAIAHTVIAFGPALVVVDSFAAILYEFGLGENDASEVLVPLRGLCRPLANAGAAVVVVDHVKKEADSRDQWGRGSGAKRGEVDASFHLKVQQPFARGKPGSALLRVTKDRYGILGGQNEIAANVTYSEDLAGRLRVTLHAPNPDEAIYRGPTRCMDAIVEILQMCAPAELSTRQIAASLRSVGKGFKDIVVRDAAEQLALDQTRPVSTRKGAKGANLYHFVSPKTDLLKAF